MRRGGTNDPPMAQMNAGARKPQGHLRKSASSADTSGLDKPREIEVHIEELILHGFDPRSRWKIGDAVEHELRRLLSERGLPATWRTNPEQLRAGRVGLTSPGKTGAQIARAIHAGIEA